MMFQGKSFYIVFCALSGRREGETEIDKSHLLGNGPYLPTVPRAATFSAGSFLPSLKGRGGGTRMGRPTDFAASQRRVEGPMPRRDFRFRRGLGSVRLAAMPLHKVPVGLWKRLRLREGIYSRLPAHYLRSLEEARTPTPVHFRPHGAKFKINPKNGQRERVEDVPIPVHYPPESQLGLWGGEGWLKGHRYVNNDKFSKRVKKVWKPQLFQRELYSEILDTRFTVTVTMRTLDLIDEAYGFDFYILKTPKEDLCSKFGMDLKRGMLLRLARQDPQLHPDDPERRAAIYDKYKAFVIPEAEAEWVGLTLDEAVEKQRLLEEKDPVPLFKVYVEELVEQLQQQALSEPAVVQKRANRT
ncbi:large ribosomal subunit protein bL28m isoform X1 [Bos javanicus]|uniref:large ribosomal subunit protein bL28m isoform X1 n=1 Tax=Bos javanicus TaxID=9906 RepID=UPI002AA6725A|nr:large ribosomal subunit protein bL28m isoform X1 [Bos javanicus]